MLETRSTHSDSNSGSNNNNNNNNLARPSSYASTTAVILFDDLDFVTEIMRIVSSNFAASACRTTTTTTTMTRSGARKSRRVCVVTKPRSCDLIWLSIGRFNYAVVDHSRTARHSASDVTMIDKQIMDSISIGSIKQLSLSNGIYVDDETMIAFFSRTYIDEKIFLQCFREITNKTLRAMIERFDGLKEIDVRFCDNVTVDEEILRSVIYDHGEVVRFNFTTPYDEWKGSSVPDWFAFVKELQFVKVSHIWNDSQIITHYITIYR